MNHIVISENMLIICHSDSDGKVAHLTHCYIPRTKHSACNTTSNQLYQTEVTPYSRLCQIIF